VYVLLPENSRLQRGDRAVSNDEPEYLKAIKRNQEQQKGAGARSAAPAPASQGPSPAEREALRWAKEVGGKEVRVATSLSGAKVAVLVQPITPFGKPPVSLEGLPNREALAERIKAAQGAGENVVGCYEITTGRALTFELQDGKVVFTAGPPRPLLKAESPERMIRRATKEAEVLAKTRKLDDRGSGRGGGGGRGR
jgi:hypothetical protein